MIILRTVGTAVYVASLWSAVALADQPVADGAGETAAPVLTAAASGTATIEASRDAALEVAIGQLVAEPSPTLDAAGREDRAALASFYDSRKGAPLWVSATGVTANGRALAKAIGGAAAYGLDPAAFTLPDLAPTNDPHALATVEVGLTLAALTYARHARGARIVDPAGMLNSNLDRKPQFIRPGDVLARLVGADDVPAALAALHPVHPQFERLRQAFLDETADGKGGGRLNATAKRLRANMEFWRWMWDDLGALHVFNNIPEYMQYVVRDGTIIRADRIVVGELGKQSSVFSRPLQEVVLRPRWRVPESIMVHELWPSLLKGGGMMRRFGLEITTKSGEPRDWRTIDWSRDDIRNYHVWQPPGGKSVLGFVKFSFPSQHTIFMHDTPDKWMFNARQRTLSHGCLRVRNPMELAEIVLAYDRGWDRAKVAQLSQSGPLDNEVAMQKHIPIHLAYFTAWAGEDGKVRYFNDIYGHEKRVTQALDGEWSKIVKGRNHLAPVKPRFDPDKVASGSVATVPANAAPRGFVPGVAVKPKKGGGSLADVIADALGL